MVSLHSSRDGANAEAAAWIARLHSSERSDATDAALQAWLEADKNHRRAFEHAAEIWGIIPAAALHRTVRSASPVPKMGSEHAAGTGGWRLAIAASLLLFVAVSGGWWLHFQPTGYATAVGEQQVVTLDDGTRITLNTDTRLRVRYADDMRSVELGRGEAMFEVAPDPARPFVVAAGDRMVRAIGTSFIVRQDGSSVMVTLIQGKVSVSDAGVQRPARSMAAAVLVPGEQLTVAGDAASLVELPSIEAATAWRRGQAVFADTPLPAAIAELNRYGGPRVILGDPRLASLRVSGVFSTNDTVEFASAIAALHGLRAEKGDGEINLVR